MNLQGRSGFYALLALIFLANFFFKLIHIASSSLWYDEIISAQDTLLDFGHIKHEAEWDKNPPFYHYALWIWSRFFGISELALRSMSAFFSALTAVLIFVFLNKVHGRRQALVITALFTLHPFLYYYAQEARCYSFLIFLVTGNLLLVYELINRPYLLKALGLGVLNFLIFYTHYIAGLILFCQFIYLGLIFRKRILYLVAIYITPVLLVLLRFTKGQYRVLFFSGESSRAKANVPLAGFENLLDALQELYVSQLLFLTYIGLLICFLLRRLKRDQLMQDRDIQFKMFVVLAPLVSQLVLYLVGIKANVFHERYLIFTVPYVIIAFSFLLENKTWLYGFALLMLIFSLPSIEFGKPRNMDYRFCAALAKELEKKQATVKLVQTQDVVNLFTYYYDREVFLSKDRLSPDYLKQKDLYYIESFNSLQQMSFDKSKPIVFFQTYQKKEEEQAIRQYFESQGYRMATIKKDAVQISFLLAR